MKNHLQLRETLLSLPTPSSNRPGRFARVAQELALRLKMADPANVRVDEGGVAYWTSNDNPIPGSVLRDAGLEPWPAQVEARENEVDRLNALLDLGRTASDDELFEMRAAFGRGTVVINAITGKRTQL